MLRRLGLLAVALSLVASTAHAAAPKRKPSAERVVTKTAKITAPPPAPPPEPPPPVVVEPPPAPPVAPPPLVAAPERDAVEPPAARARHLVTVTLNPLPMIAGRYGANVELVPLAHHAITANLYYQSLQPWVLDRILPKEVEKGTLPGRPGGELGYRLYSGTDGASGVFVGPSLVWMPIFYPQVTEQLRAEVVPLDAFGGAIDVGAQAILGGGFTIGGGVGVMALAYTPPKSVTPPPGIDAPTFVEPHVLPRLLFAAGWSF